MDAADSRQIGISMYVHNCHYKLASTKCSTWNTRKIRANVPRGTLTTSAASRLRTASWYWSRS